MLQNIDRFMEFLRSYGFGNIHERAQYISFGRDEYSSAKSIVVYKYGSDRIMIHDYARNLHCGLTEYLMKEKGAEPSEVFVEMQRYLGLSSFSNEENLRLTDLKADIIEKPSQEELMEEPEVVSETLLEAYPKIFNERFLKDGISLRSQKKFGLRYDTEKGLIVIPIRRDDGALVGIKARVNRDIEHGELKYFYLENCQITKTLYGYSQNKECLLESKRIFLFEAEKSVMQADTFGVHNCLALGSSSISQYQCELINRLQPESIYVLTDQGLDEEYVNRLCSTIQKYCMDVLIYIWKANDSIPDKASPTDLGEKSFKEILERDIVLWQQPS